MFPYFVCILTFWEACNTSSNVFALGGGVVAEIVRELIGHHGKVAKDAVLP